ncbi:Cys-Gln thioester bond-forming surface protein [Streptomyces sp. TRM 70351]|uniref:Cys-Gln thioester bond-forming surface protein n=1 Tax=Streptomyces sp. TRM 70351 TaxID=3116552 RepID=UPI002E7B15F1|nr:Cys-Gln thioester bond-forming surface protein [Streptomyces sp. TRM 70351]MEE1929469.1 Cys-Gln thioester bond-forming surface protein [Streptomyces sp. TRM 70351]
MQPVHRRAVGRIAAAVLAPCLLVAGGIAGAAPAAADDNPGQPGGATATLDGLKTYANAVINQPDGTKDTISAGLFEMTVDGGGTLKTYCIDIGRNTVDKARYGEVSWSESSLNDNEKAGHILWILQNSYPQVSDLDALAEAAGIRAGRLTPKTAAAGTQVAIWRFSDGADVVAKNAAAEKLADYLEGAAQDVAEPAASLSLSPEAVSGKAGERLGPVTVDTNAASVSIGAPEGAEGVRIVDADGNVVTTAADGGELYFDVPEGTEPGSASLSAQAATQVPIGRVFSSIGEVKSQTQILAGSTESTVTATATATWANEGPIPAVTAEKNCVAGGVDLTVTNEGDETFEFTVGGETHQVEPQGETTVTVPVGEDQQYAITVTGTNGFEATFEGVLDCETEGTSGGGSTGGGDDTTGGSTGGGDGTSGGSTGGEDDTTGGTTGGGEGETPQEESKTPVGDGDLAATGSSSNTPLMIGAAFGLILVGGAVTLFLRKRKSSGVTGA